MWWHVSSCSDDNKITKSLYNHLCLINSRIYLFVLIHSAIATSSQCLLVSEVWTRTSRDNNQLRISKSKTNKTDLEPAPVQCQHQSWPQWWHWRWWRWWDVCPITYLRSVTNSLVWRVSVNTSAAPWRVSPRRGLWLWQILILQIALPAPEHLDTYLLWIEGGWRPQSLWPLKPGENILGGITKNVWLGRGIKNIL